MENEWKKQQRRQAAAAAAAGTTVAPTPVPAAGTPAWLTELIAVLEAILGVIPIFEGHTTESAVRAQLVDRLARLKENLPK